MIRVVDREEQKITYRCDCGVEGSCFIKPLEQEGAIVISVACPECNEAELITLLQYDSEESKELLLEKLNELKFTYNVSKETDTDD